MIMNSRSNPADISSDTRHENDLLAWHKRAWLIYPMHSDNKTLGTWDHGKKEEVIPKVGTFEFRLCRQEKSYELNHLRAIQQIRFWCLFPSVGAIIMQITRAELCKQACRGTALIPLAKGLSKP